LHGVSSDQAGVAHQTNDEANLDFSSRNDTRSPSYQFSRTILGSGNEYVRQFS
jgi:hypothetical protein